MGIIFFMCQSKTIRNDYFYLKNESRDWGSSNNFLLLYLLRHWLYSLIVLLFLPLIFISGYIPMRVLAYISYLSVTTGAKISFFLCELSSLERDVDYVGFGYNCGCWVLDSHQGPAFAISAKKSTWKAWN